MKQEIPPAAIVAAIVALVVIVGLIGWKVFGSNSNTIDQATLKAHMAYKLKKEGP